MKKLTTPQRLIVAADFKPDPLNRNGARWVRNQVLDLADSLADLGVCLKVNSALRACGYDLIEEIRGRGLEVFADLKLVDIPQTLETDGAILRLSRPNLVTIMCAADTLAMHKLSAELPDTEVLGVTVLSSIEEGAQTLFGASISSRVISYADMALRAGISGLIASPKELRDLRGSAFSSRWRSLTVVTPGIRPSWSLVEGDDQNPDRVMTPAAAIRAGADRIVVGRPIIKAENARVAALRTLEEIESAMVAA